ncbi:MAG: helix-hairpin-helix domain-containing protein [Microbacteriaceae bacterium]|nr:helix-hairpin-helix domain-containing protein [Microbacteriaceae bacterium]
MSDSPRIVPAPRSRLRVGLGAAVVLVIFGAAVAVAVYLFGGGGSTERVAAPPSIRSESGSGADGGGAVGADTFGSDAAAPAPDAGAGSFAPAADAASSAGKVNSASPDSAQIYVHLVGAVNRPGLYQLRAGSRAIDAVAAAGGFAADADQAPLNLARLLSDGEQIVVTVIGQSTPAQHSDVNASAEAKVNLNTADAAALDTLPGVGPATAKDILDWRKKNGRFSSLEDLLSVGGIGEKTFAQLKDRVTL